MKIEILDRKWSIDEVKKLAENWYGTMIKGCVDVKKERVAIGGDYHIESAELLTGTGSVIKDVWGFNIRFEENPDGVLEFDPMVNIKPNIGNKSRKIIDQEISERAGKIIKKFIELK
jgi:hypothetical protein